MGTDLGLAAGIVRLQRHSDKWSRAYEAERATLRQALGDLAMDIEHVGSTAVPGLEAKPIIDIAIAIAEEADAGPVSDRLLELGYGFAVDAGSAGGLIFFKESAAPIRTHHVHVVRADDAQWRNYLAFRDRLRADTRLRAEYAQLKQRLAREFASDRDGYTAAKTEFIARAVGG